jgi:hypothetical protein
MIHESSERLTTPVNVLSLFLLDLLEAMVQLIQQFPFVKLLLFNSFCQWAVSPTAKIYLIGFKYLTGPGESCDNISDF